MLSARDRSVRRAARIDFDPPRARDLRSRWVEELDRAGELSDGPTRVAFLQVPRHAFVPGGVPLDDVYSFRPVLIGCGQMLLPPAVVARMTEALELTGRERVLHVGTGSGYHAALLSELAAEVHTIELVGALARRAAAVLAELGCSNVSVRTSDGGAGWPERAPFDRVAVAAATERAEPAWFDQLGMSGIVVAPTGGPWGGQRLTRYRRRAHGVTTEDLGPVAFVPLLVR